jgi:glycosyltransferase involved in cell wall biosynthesis
MAGGTPRGWSSASSSRLTTKSQRSARSSKASTDDGSTDATAEIATSKGVLVVPHGANKGYGASLKTGVERSRHETLLIIDGDGTYSPEDIAILLEGYDGEDMIVGARDSQEASLPGLRRLAKRSLQALAGHFTGVRIPDLNSGMRLLKKDAVLEYLDLLPSGFSFTSTITLALLKNDRRVRFVPIRYFPRREGSKFLPYRETFRVLRQIVRTMLRLEPRKIMLHLAVLFLVPGSLLTVYQAVVRRKVTAIPLLIALAGLAIGLFGIRARRSAFKPQSRRPIS